SQRSAPTHTPRKRPFELHSAWFPPRTPAAPRFFSWPCCCSRAPAWAARHGAWRRQRLRTITRARRRSRRLRTPFPGFPSFPKVELPPMPEMPTIPGFSSPEPEPEADKP
uniref:Uncharacterized protein n=1 Tax=Aegilops tauschii subsp. strangulata TaxID=200361 RepID=A0A453B5J1_AEGTS